MGFDTSWMKEEKFVKETPYLKYVNGEYIKFWLPERINKDYMPKIEPMKDGEGNLVKNNGNVVRRANWKVVNEKGKIKEWGVTVGGSKSLYGQVLSIIKEASKEKQRVIGLKVKRTGAGMQTSYSVMNHTDKLPKIDKGDYTEEKIEGKD